MDRETQSKPSPETNIKGQVSFELGISSHGKWRNHHMTEDFTKKPLRMVMVCIHCYQGFPIDFPAFLHPFHMYDQSQDEEMCKSLD